MALAPKLAEAVRAFQMGQLKQARALAAELAAGQEASPEADHLLGLIDCRTGDFETAVGHLRRAFDADSANPQYRLILARALIDCGQAEEALRIAVAGLTTGPAAVPFLQLQAEAADRLGDRAASEAANRALTRALPGDWRAWNNLGSALAASEQWGDAADALQQALRLNDDLGIRGSLAAALHRAGRIEQAVAELNILADRQQDDSEAQLAIGRQLVALAEFDRAEELLDAVRRLRRGCRRLAAIQFDLDDSRDDFV
jgi:predicted Zn-dependent protease